MADQLYCPICTDELDKSLSCWVRCEYEADGALPKYLPLTKRQALKRRIAEGKRKLDLSKDLAKRIRSEISEYENELNQL